MGKRERQEFREELDKLHEMKGTGDENDREFWAQNARVAEKAAQMKPVEELLARGGF